MPTKQKPLLRNSQFPHYNISCEIKQQIRKRRMSILERVGFCREYGVSDTFSEKRTYHASAKAILSELDAILATAVWEYVERDPRGFRQQEATLVAIERDPFLAISSKIEIDPVVMDRLEANYQSLGEGPWPNAESTRRAAQKALVQLRAEPVRRGPPGQPFKRNLAGRLVRLFLRFHEKAGRSSSFHTDQGRQFESGQLLSFMVEVESVLNGFFKSGVFKSELQAMFGTKTPKISAEWLTREAAQWRHQLGDIP